MLRILILALLAVGCSSTSKPATVALADVPAREAVTCSGDDCSLCWDRAQLWLVGHSKWKIQTATNAVIQTFSPAGSEPSYGFTVTKEPDGTGAHRIRLSMSCGNMLGCSPKPVDVARAFYHYVETGED